VVTGIVNIPENQKRRIFGGLAAGDEPSEGAATYICRSLMVNLNDRLRMMTTDPATRIAELELRISEQDRVIADLNEMVVSQWRKIDNLERRFGELREEFDASAASRTDTHEPPPPHY
jgi:uncharacterized coiled-coil protein SlyX